MAAKHRTEDPAERVCGQTMCLLRVPALRWSPGGTADPEQPTGHHQEATRVLAEQVAGHSPVSESPGIEMTRPPGHRGVRQRNHMQSPPTPSTGPTVSSQIGFINR